MLLKQAAFILRRLLFRDADCRDGNLDITEQEKEAIRTMLTQIDINADSCIHTGREWMGKDKCPFCRTGGESS
jgi:hypothetical protein